MQITVYKKEKVMTVAEVANAMGVSKDTVRNCIKRVFPNKVQNGKQTFLNEKEVACISKELKSNVKVTEQLTFEAGSKVKNSTTELEVISNALDAFKALEDLYNQKILGLQTERDNLKIQLDESKEWYSIKRMQKLNPDEDFSYSLLKKESIKLGYPIKKVFDMNYGEVNSYHRDVWESLYSDTINYGD